MRRQQWFWLGTSWLIIFAIVAINAWSAAAQTPPESALWRETSLGSSTATTSELPRSYRALRADLPALEALLAQAPTETSPQAWQRAITLELPRRSVGFARFEFVETAVLAPELAARYPNLKTYLGRSRDNPNLVARLTRTSQGLHGFVLGDGQALYLEPFGAVNEATYLVYDRLESNRPDGLSFPNPLGADLSSEALLAQTRSAGGQLRTFRLAVGATGEFSQAVGGTKAAALERITAVINALNLIYERDLSVRLQIVANSDLLIYTDPIADPYTNSSRELMLDQHQDNATSQIGSANYDIGHLFSTFNGGIAGLNTVCLDDRKGLGNSGAGPNANLSVLVDVSTHEIGHQFGAAHSFNGTTELCASGRSALSAYEPASGSTIMSYTGICGSENLQTRPDLFFHSHSLDQIFDHLGAVSCGNLGPVLNNPPSVDAGSNYTIPANTAFELRGSGSDPDGDTLSYSWEQLDLGNPSPPNDDDGTRPLFRTFPPQSLPVRLLPQFLAIVNDTASLGESLPSTNRTLTFRLTARDNRSGAGALSYDTMSVNVTTAAGPFRITAPVGGERFNQGSTINIAWNVANTDQAPVNCANVTISLSEDGGSSYTTLVASTANDGSASAPLPNRPLITAHLKLACSDNIFLDISPAFSSSGSIITKFSDDNGPCTSDDCSLREAVALVNSLPGPDQLQLEAGTFSLNLIGAGPLEIRDSLTIRGAGSATTIIDGNNLDRIISVTRQVSLTLRDLTIRNGNAAGNGGALFNNFGAVTLENVIIENSTASNDGGAIHNRGQLTIANSVLRNNSAVRYGGGISSQLSTIFGDYDPLGSLTIHDSTLSGNNAGELGGAIFYFTFSPSAEARMQIERSTLSGNTALNGGGALYFNLNSAVTSVSLLRNSTLSGNSGNNFAGAIALFGSDGSGSMSLEFNTIANNSTGFGGGLYADRINASFTGNLFALNQDQTCRFNDPPRGTYSSNGFNLISDGSCGFNAATDLNGAVGAPLDAALQPLANNGGPTQSHELGAASIARDNGGLACPASDQRGATRPNGPACDIGAIESGAQVPATPTNTPVPPTNTPVPPTSTATPRPPTSTPRPPTSTATPRPTNTSVPLPPTSTTLPGSPTSTPRPTNTSVPLPSPTNTPIPEEVFVPLVSVP